MDLTLVPYQQDQQYGHNNNTARQLHTSTKKHNPNPTSNYVKYKECMKNHAASIGGHANDGCGEFMPRTAIDDYADDNIISTSNNSLSLTCAACGCHRNFHRREGTAAGNVRHQHPLHFEHLMLSPTPLLQGAIKKKHSLITYHDQCDDIHEDMNNGDDQDRRSETPEREEVNIQVGFGGGLRAVAKNKRFRTKFTQEQKDKMFEFAEKIGWRINKNDYMALNQFCNEVGVKRNVLKVWMHNNKNAHRRKDVQEQSQSAGAVAAAGAAPLPPAPPQAIGV